MTGSPTEPEPEDEAEAEDEDEVPAAIAAAVLAVPGVVALSTGPADQFRSYLPDGRSVSGVRVDADGIQLNLVARFGTVLPELGDAVRHAVAPWSAHLPVAVSVDDLAEDDHPDAVAADAVDDPSRSD